MEGGEYYFNIPDVSKKESAINRLLDSLINARKKAKFPSNAQGFDEDVNLYMAHLLYAMSMPNYTSITEQYISFYNAEVRVLADMAEDKYLKYFILKVNADNLLIHLGIFQDLAQRKHKKDKQKDIDAYVNDAQEFYMSAAQLNKKIYRRKTAIADVLSKLAKNLPSYVKVLFYLRKDFFLFLNRYEDSEFCTFLDHMKRYEKKMEFEQKQNLFLDLYSQWLKRKSSMLRSKINNICHELHELDPTFKFKLE